MTDTFTIERNTKPQCTHGLSHIPEYISWTGMKDRCYRPKNEKYHNYGGRGITICDEWVNSFESFIQDMGLRPSPEHSIDRMNNDGNYELNNCRWATNTEQLHNRRDSPNRTQQLPRGVYKSKLRFKASITHKGINIYLGHFITPQKASAFRNKYITQNKLPHKLSSIKQ